MSATFLLRSKNPHFILEVLKTELSSSGATLNIGEWLKYLKIEMTSLIHKKVALNLELRDCLQILNLFLQDGKSLLTLNHLEDSIKTLISLTLKIPISAAGLGGYERSLSCFGGEIFRLHQLWLLQISKRGSSGFISAQTGKDGLIVKLVSYAVDCLKENGLGRKFSGSAISLLHTALSLFPNSSRPYIGQMMDILTPALEGKESNLPQKLLKVLCLACEASGKQKRMPAWLSFSETCLVNFRMSLEELTGCLSLTSGDKNMNMNRNVNVNESDPTIRFPRYLQKFYHSIEALKAIMLHFQGSLDATLPISLHELYSASVSIVSLDLGAMSATVKSVIQTTNGNGLDSDECSMALTCLPLVQNKCWDLLLFLMQNGNSSTFQYASQIANALASSISQRNCNSFCLDLVTRISESLHGSCILDSICVPVINQILNALSKSSLEGNDGCYLEMLSLLMEKCDFISGNDRDLAHRIDFCLATMALNGSSMLKPLLLCQISKCITTVLVSNVFIHAPLMPIAVKFLSENLCHSDHRVRKLCSESLSQLDLLIQPRRNIGRSLCKLSKQSSDIPDSKETLSYVESINLTGKSNVGMVDDFLQKQSSIPQDQMQHLAVDTLISDQDANARPEIQEQQKVSQVQVQLETVNSHRMERGSVDLVDTKQIGLGSFADFREPFDEAEVMDLDDDNNNYSEEDPGSPVQLIEDDPSDVEE